MATITPAATSTDICGICRAPMDLDERPKIGHDWHIFHQDCLTPWLAIKPHCPSCHAQFSNAHEYTLINNSPMRREAQSKLEEQASLSVDSISGVALILIVTILSSYI